MNKCCFILLNEMEEFIRKHTITQEKDGNINEKVNFDIEDWDCFKQRIAGN